jgi:DNA helicase-2/ATP-dependent DNA helicase PcrA
MTEILEADGRLGDPLGKELLACMDAVPPKSFFLFAGAGSGKTRALVTALNRFRRMNGNRMRLHGQQIAVITYTNAACDEIKRRLDFDPLLSVSTIHSFVWDLIQGFNGDIRSWLKGNLRLEIDELRELLRKGRSGTKTAIERERSIAVKQERLTSLDTIKRFIYSPNGENRTRDSLSHAEVIKIGAAFLTEKPLLQKILVTRFPALLIDESQDTNKLLMEAILSVQRQHRQHFRVGLFGDMMQRIYADGKIDLGRNLPSDWATPEININHRCPRRVIRLINTIRSAVDTHKQEPRTDASEGHVRLFIAPTQIENKRQLEAQVRERMAELTGDQEWTQAQKVKTLTLEHHMAAKRMNFFEMFEPLYRIDDYRTGLLKGELTAIRFFSDHILPVVVARENKNDFAATAVVRRESPLLKKDVLQAAGANQLERVKEAKAAVETLMALWADGAEPCFLDVLQCVANTGLFEVPDVLRPFAVAENDVQTEPEPDDPANTEESPPEITEAIHKFLATPFVQIRPYVEYVSGEAAFGTHQGVKGLEFPRVLVVVDDEEARGFMFSYEKLLGAENKTRADLEHERAGEETSIDRTRRLLYVTCSRAEKSLAIVAYSSSPGSVQQHAIAQGWFETGEIELLN